MDPGQSTVKRRPYDGTGRRNQAERRRTAALDAAEHLFLTGGYLSTTLETISARSGVSRATILKSYGGKSGLLRSVCERALEGQGPIPAEARSDALRATASPSDLVQGWGRLLTEVSPHVSPLLLVLIQAAGTDPELAALRDDLERERLTRMADNAAALARLGALRPGLTRGEVRDVLWLASSPELFDLLVVRRGWSTARYGRHVTQMMLATLLA
jgi:AcrR family transcriptional regulator